MLRLSVIETECAAVSSGCNNYFLNLMIWLVVSSVGRVEHCLQAKVTGSIPVQPIPANERLVC